MKSILTGLIVITVAVAVTGCAVSRDTNVLVNGDRKVGVASGRILTVSLAANPTTGYGWTLSEKPDPAVLRQRGLSEYEPESDRIGAGGIETFKFDAGRKGKTSMIFEYRRPWEKDTEPARQYRVQVVVH